MLKKKCVPAGLIPQENVPANPVMIFSPKHDMYKIIRIFQPGLPTLHDLMCDHIMNSDPRLPELWYDILPFKFEGRDLVIRLHWGQDQFAEDKVSCQVFLLGDRHTHFMEKISMRLHNEGIYQQITLFGYEESA